MLLYYQHYSSVDPEKEKYISFIGKYEFYNRRDVINIQQLIENIIAGFKIDISATGYE